MKGKGNNTRPRDERTRTQGHSTKGEVRGKEEEWGKEAFLGDERTAGRWGGGKGRKGLGRKGR